MTLGVSYRITVPTVGLNKVTRLEIHNSAIASLKEMGKPARLRHVRFG